LLGAKPACGLEQCGACLVAIDGAVRPSCRVPVGEVAGKSVRTVEGLAAGGALHRVQEAFIAEDALQCGFCTAGFVVAAVALLEKNPDPGDEEIRAGLDRNLCRCGVYPRIYRAVRRAAGRPVELPAVLVLDRPLPGTPAPAAGPPASFERSPELDDWLRIDPEGTVTLFAGKVEFGQGILTALAQVAAEELDVDFRRMRVATAATGVVPDEGMTVGSMSLMTTGVAVRAAAAEARGFLLALALEELEAAPAALAVEDGTVTDSSTGRSTTYWDLLGGKPFGRRLTGTAARKDPAEYRVLGKSERRLDTSLLHNASQAAKVSGAPVFLHDFRPDGLVHARVLRPPRPGARLVSLETGPTEAGDGVLAVVRDGSFAAVIAENDRAAVQALETLRLGATWEGGDPLPGGDDAAAYLKSQPAQSFHIVDGTPVEGQIPASPIRPIAHSSVDGHRIINASYSRPFQMHAALGPSAAVARLRDGRLTLWVHSQGVYPVRRFVASALGMDEGDIDVIHLEGPGCYGHNGSDDAAFDAALLARAHPGPPVMVTWSRADEHRWEPYAPAMAVELAAALDGAGRIAAWDHQVWSFPHLGRSSEGGDVSGLLASWYLAEPKRRPVPQPSVWNNAGGYRNADPLYELSNKRVVKHFVADRPLRTSSMRGLGAFTNVFALESFMDELAFAAGQDLLAFRLAYLEDARAREVLQAAAALAGWELGGRPRRDGTGRGLAFARYKNSAAYCAVVVDLAVERDRIRLERAWIAADAGQIVNPDGLANQLEGGLVQAASWTLKEAVRYGPEGVESVDWETYPILRFTDSPEIRTVILNRPGAPFLGGGEASSGPAGAAIANALFDATGKRLRDLPLTL
ncbi:MAG TPA: molybdopterin cofactor-binding domain-containing protein, partial [Anaerolineales bacterium]|nr:molybdopterin cofactor-binding domain-containing protein [Anaerolineales bacterium]